jgi:hypothetical protein
MMPEQQAAWLAREWVRVPIAPILGQGTPEDEPPARCVRCGGAGSFVHQGFRSTLFYRAGGAWLCYRCAQGMAS